MKIVTRNRFYVVAVIALLALVGPATAADPIVIKFPHVVAPSTPKGQGAKLFQDMVHERLPGRVVVEIYPSSQLMSDNDSIEALAFGEIQMIAISLSKFDRLTKKFQVFDLPFMFDDLESVDRFQASPVGRSLLKVIEHKGFLGLAYWHNGMKHIGAPRALRDPEEARGLNFRIMESDVLQAQIQQIGANPQKMAFGEVYQALQTGAIDAQENTWSNMYSQKFHEVQDFIMETNHGFVGYLVAVNPDFWNGLPDDIRLELDQIVEEVAQTVNANAAKLNAEAKEKIQKAGKTQIITLTPEEIASWREAMQPVWRQFEDDIGAEILQAAASSNLSK